MAHDGTTPGIVIGLNGKLHVHTPQAFSDYLAFGLFGLSSWIMVNSVYMGLPIFVTSLNEGYRISSWIALAIQLANIFPLLFVLWWKLLGRNPLPYVVSVPALLIMGMGSLILMSKYWEYDTTILDTPFSFSIVGVAFIGGAIDCTSSVIYWPFVSHFGEELISALALGESMSGALPALVALIQHPSDPLFSPSVYFLVMGGVLLTSFLAFLFIAIKYREKIHRTSHVVRAPSSIQQVSEAFSIDSLAQPQYGYFMGLEPDFLDVTHNLSTATDCTVTFSSESVSPQLKELTDYSDEHFNRLNSLSSSASPLSASPGSTAPGGNSGRRGDSGLSAEEEAAATGPAAGRASSVFYRTTPGLGKQLFFDKLEEGRPMEGIEESLYEEEGYWRQVYLPIALEAWQRFCMDGMALVLLPYAVKSFPHSTVLLTWYLALTFMCRPLAMLVTRWPPCRCHKLVPLTLLWSGLFLLLLVFAASKESAARVVPGWLVVLALTVMVSVAAYTHSMTFIELARRGEAQGVPRAEKGRRFRLAGLGSQVGAFLGTCVSFLLVNCSTLFEG